MGRQIAVALTQIDELSLLSFLQSQADIRLIESFASSPDALWVDQFAAELPDHWTYQIWNRRFPWRPIYGQVGNRAYRKEAIGMYYVSNLNDAPVIEFSRSDVPGRSYGRLYWSKFFAAPNGLDYDVDAFSEWYDSVVRWVRRNSAGKMKSSWVTWFLPDAWRIHTEEAGAKIGG